MSQDAPRLLEPTPAPEIYVDATVGFFLHGGVVSVSLVTARANHTEPGAPVANHVVLRLVMAISGAQNLAVTLYDFLRQRGGMPAASPVAAPRDASAEAAGSERGAATETPASTLIDHPEAPEFYVDSAAGFFMRGDVVTITFATTRHDHAGGESYRAMTVRVVLPTAGARSLAELLFDFLRARGFDPAPRPADARVQ